MFELDYTINLSINYGIYKLDIYNAVYTSCFEVQALILTMMASRESRDDRLVKEILRYKNINMLLYIRKCYKCIVPERMYVNPTTFEHIVEYSVEKKKLNVIQFCNFLKE